MRCSIILVVATSATRVNARSSFIGRCAVLAATLFALAACGDDDEEARPAQITIDASSRTDFAFFSLTDGREVSVADARTSVEWEVALRRFSAKLNGGVAGPGNVSGYNVSNNSDASGEQVAALSPEDADAAFGAVTEADIDQATFVFDSLIPDPGASWFNFSPQAGTLVANPSAAWQVREADGGFAIFRVSELEMAGMQSLGASIEFRHQDAGGALGQMGSVTIDFAQGPGLVDFSSGSTVAVDGCNWDLTLTPTLSIDFNTDCNAGSFPLDSAADFSALTTAADAPEYGGFLAAISGAIPNSVDDATAVFWYDIQDQNILWPTFNVFLINTGSAIYKLQFLKYYNTADVSGYPTIRYVRLR